MVPKCCVNLPFTCTDTGYSVTSKRPESENRFCSTMCTPTLGLNNGAPLTSFICPACVEVTPGAVVGAGGVTGVTAGVAVVGVSAGLGSGAGGFAGSSSSSSSAGFGAWVSAFGATRLSGAARLCAENNRAARRRWLRMGV